MKVTKEYLKHLIVEAIEESSMEEIENHQETNEMIRQLKSKIEQKQKEIKDLEKQVRKLHASKRKPAGPIPRDADGNMLDAYGNLRKGAAGSPQRAAYERDLERRKAAGEFDNLKPFLDRFGTRLDK